MKTLWVRYRVFILELFCWANLSFLAVDILYAHSANDFAHPAEWIPFVFSALTALVLVPGLIRIYRHRKIVDGYPYWMGFVTGWLSIIIGIAGIAYHLHSGFFQKMTIQSLVYAAPFVAPLAYTGIGLLLLLNRKLSPQSHEWSLWILFLALGGFAGNFVLALADHAQNGFFHLTEWIPVVTAALASSFLLVLFFTDPDSRYYRLCLWILGVQVVTGVLGFLLHLQGNLMEAGSDLLTNFIHGAPVFAPLLFPNLAILAAIGLWDLWMKQQERRQAETA